MKLKNLPPFKVGDVIEYDIRCPLSRFIVVAVDVSSVTGRCRLRGNGTLTMTEF